jgi:diguanylate cyclase (GGDEF)-like protein
MVALEENSLTDPLTGLRNRRFLMANLDQDVALHLRRHEDAQVNGAAVNGAAAAESDMLFFLVDIDHFKQINDRHGHAGGDAVLVQMKGRLQRVFRDSDYLVRWGGEEFLAIARATQRSHAETLAERIRCSMADEPFRLDDGKDLPVTCSIGFAVLPFFPDQARLVHWAEIVDMADIGLYIAKRAGRNGWAGLIASDSADRAVVIRQAKENLPPLVSRGDIKVISNLEESRVLDALPAPSVC